VNPVLTVQNLSYGSQRIPLLKQISFSVEPGKLLVISGASGEGKSTLLRLLLGLEKPSSGSIRIFNRDLADLDAQALDKLRSRIGFVFQNSALLSTLTVAGNLRLPLVYHNLAEGVDLEKRVHIALENLLIKSYKDQFPAQLSLGIQKRTAMARAIITRPEIILMDEPTSGLDNISRNLLIALIENIRLTHDVAIVMVTNDLSAVKKLDCKIGILTDGELYEPLTYNELLTSPDPFVQALMEDLHDVSRM